MKGILTTHVRTESRDNAEQPFVVGPVVTSSVEIEATQHPYLGGTFLTHTTDEWGSPLVMSRVWTTWTQTSPKWYEVK